MKKQVFLVLCVLVLASMACNLTLPGRDLRTVVVHAVPTDGEGDLIANNPKGKIKVYIGNGEVGQEVSGTLNLTDDGRRKVSVCGSGLEMHYNNRDGEGYRYFLISVRPGGKIGLHQGWWFTEIEMPEKGIYIVDEEYGFSINVMNVNGSWFVNFD